MSALSDYVTGTLTLTNGSNAFTGTGTGWLAAGFKEGDTLIDITGATEYMGVVATVTANGAGTLTKAWEGPTVTNVAYRMRYQPDGARMGAQARNLIEVLGNGNLQALAGLSGAADKFPMFTAAGAMTLVPKTDLVSGAAYDVQVANLAARAAYDGQAQGFAVLVANVGDGRAAIYSKNSATSADWSAAAYVTGPASTVPGPSGVIWRGAYSGATAYAANDGALDNGSSWRAKIATTGNAPPALPTTSNTQWELLAAKGTDGTGTGDMVGPASSVDGQFAAANGTTGKLLKFLTTAQATAALNALVGDAGAGGTKGLVPAPAAGDAAAGKFLKADGTWAAVSIAELELTVSQLALQVADNTNVALFLGPTGNRVADSFDTLTYVDVAGGTNLDSSVAGLLKATSTVGARLIGTSATADINDNNPATFIAPPLNNLTGASVASRVLGSIDYGASVAITRIEAKASYGGGLAGAGLYYSNDNSNWTQLGVNFSITGSLSTYQQDGSVSARYIAFVVPAAAYSGTAVTLYDLNGYGASPANMTVRSASFTAAAAPTKMKALIRVKEVDAATAGADYTLECSRDGGSTYTVMTLAELFTSPSPTANIRVVEAAETSVSGQPSGTAPRWRFKTLNNKSVELHDVYFYWS